LLWKEAGAEENFDAAGLAAHQLQDGYTWRWSGAERRKWLANPFASAPSFSMSGTAPSLVSASNRIFRFLSLSLSLI
jgi:hypothetical protein